MFDGIDNILDFRFVDFVGGDCFEVVVGVVVYVIFGMGERGLQISVDGGIEDKVLW